MIFDLSPAISQIFSRMSLGSPKKRGGEHEVAGYMYIHMDIHMDMKMYPPNSPSPPRSPPRFLDEAKTL